MSVSVDIGKCQGCGICVPLCPVQAISIIENKAFIDQNSCNECLQCISECPYDAIYQISEKEIPVTDQISEKETPVTERHDRTPYSFHRTSPQSSQIFWRNERKQKTLQKSGSLLDRIREIANIFFNVDSSFGTSRKGGRIKHRGQRRRHRGGRF
jgi:NAD-dependent dihydropyrimidine dehydrogenase PreA subunit